MVSIYNFYLQNKNIFMEWIFNFIMQYIPDIDNKQSNKVLTSLHAGSLSIDSSVAFLCVCSIWSPVTETAKYPILEEGSSSNTASRCLFSSPVNARDHMLWFLVEDVETGVVLVLIVLSSVGCLFFVYDCDFLFLPYTFISN